MLLHGCYVLVEMKPTMVNAFKRRMMRRMRKVYYLEDHASGEAGEVLEPAWEEVKHRWEVMGSFSQAK